MKKLTKAAEALLLSALNQVADQTRENENPNEVIAKVASDMQIPHGHVQLLVNAYNTGRTTAQRKSSDDVWAKAAEFPIADAATILKQMYPENIKTASQKFSETVVSTDYALPPSWLHKKEASAKIDWKMVDPPAPYPKLDNSYAKAKAEVQRIDNEVKEARYKASYAFDLALQLKEEIKEYLKSALYIPISEVRANAELMYGDIVKPLFDQIVSEAPQLTKRSYSTGLKPATDKVYDMLANCLEMSDAYQALKQEYETKEAEANQEKVELMRPFGEAPKKLSSSPASVLGAAFSKDAFLDSFMGDADKGTGFHGVPGRWAASPPLAKTFQNKHPWLTSLGSMIDKSPMLPGTSARAGVMADLQKERLKDQYEKKMDPGYEQTGNMLAIQQQAMLSDMMANDEVLSKRDPHEILRHFASLREIAPRAAGNRESLRALLRDRVERGGAASIFDVDALTKVEKNLKGLEASGKSKDKEE